MRSFSKVAIVSAALVAAFVGFGCETPSEPAIAGSKSGLFVDPQGEWETDTIEVCWTGPSQPAEARQWLREAIEGTWEQVIDIDFTNWGTCSTPLDPNKWQITVGLYSQGSTSDVNSAYTGFNFQLPRTKDMMLSYYMNSYPECDSDDPVTFSVTGRTWDSRREMCFKNMAVHEFGHSLRFFHEQDYEDVPTPCHPDTHPYPWDYLPQHEPQGLRFENEYDPVSVMNYCSPTNYIVGGETVHDRMLSPWDIAGAQSLYGRAANDFLWFSHGNVNNYFGPFDEDYMLFEPRKQSIAGNYKGVSADFNHDGRDDIYWYGPGAVGDRTWRFNANRTYSLGLQPGEGGQPDVLGNFVPLAGDFDGDTHGDIFFYNLADGDEFAWFSFISNGQAYFQYVFYSVGSGYTPFTGDFDGDDRTDIFYYKPGNGNDYIRWGSSNRAFPLSPDQDVSGTFDPIVGDFNGDGRDDILWYRAGTASDPLWRGNADRTFTPFNTTLVQDGNYKHVVGDFDGNGVDDLYWITSLNTDRMWLFEGTPTFADDRVNVPIYGQYDYAISGDFDGDSLDDIMLFND